MGEDKEKQGEHSLKDEIRVKICNMDTGMNPGVGGVSNKRILWSLKDLATIVSLSSQLVINELKLLREDLKNPKNK